MNAEMQAYVIVFWSVMKCLLQEPVISAWFAEELVEIALLAHSSKEAT